MFSCVLSIALLRSVNARAGYELRGFVEHLSKKRRTYMLPTRTLDNRIQILLDQKRFSSLSVTVDLPFDLLMKYRLSEGALITSDCFT